MVETHRGLCSPGVIRKGFLEEAMFAWRPVGRIAVDQAEREREAHFGWREEHVWSYTETPRCGGEPAGRSVWLKQRQATGAACGKRLARGEHRGPCREH